MKSLVVSLAIFMMALLGANVSQAQVSVNTNSVALEPYVECELSFTADVGYMITSINPIPDDASIVTIRETRVVSSSYAWVKFFGIEIGTTYIRHTIKIEVDGEVRTVYVNVYVEIYMSWIIPQSSSPSPLLSPSQLEVPQRFIIKQD